MMASRYEPPSSPGPIGVNCLAELHTMIHARVHTLAHVPLFQGLSVEQLAGIESKCAWKSIDPDQTIVHYQDNSTDIYFLISGRARVLIYSAAGRAVEFRDFAVGQFFGEYSAIDGKPRSASVVAVEKCVIAAIPGRVFRGILEQQPSVTLKLLEGAVTQIRSLTDRVFEFSTLAVKNRIHAEVLRLAKVGQIAGNQARIVDCPTHFEIANRISTSREAVTRELNWMEEAGVISRNGRHDIVCKLDHLRRLVDEATGV